MRPRITPQKARDTVHEAVQFALQTVADLLDRAILKAARQCKYTTQVEFNERPVDAIMDAYAAYKIRVERVERGHVDDRDDCVVYVATLDWSAP
jgi:hypothetical protein